MKPHSVNLKKTQKKHREQRIDSKVRIHNIVRTRYLAVYDDSDRKRISLAAHAGVEPKVTIYKEDGTPAIEISSMEIDSDSRRIVLFGNSYTWRVWIGCNKKGMGIFLFDEKENCIGSWNLETGKSKSSTPRSKAGSSIQATQRPPAKAGARRNP